VSVGDVKRVDGSAVDGVVDGTQCVTTSADCTHTSELSSETQNSLMPTSVDDIKQEQQPEYEDSSANCGAEDRLPGLDCSELALILKLQRDMAAMQLQLSNLQDALRTANTTLQQSAATASVQLILVTHATTPSLYIYTYRAAGKIESANLSSLFTIQLCLLANPILKLLYLKFWGDK